MAARVDFSPACHPCADPRTPPIQAPRFQIATSNCRVRIIERESRTRTKLLKSTITCGFLSGYAKIFHFFEAHVNFVLALMSDVRVLPADRPRTHPLEYRPSTVIFSTIVVSLRVTVCVVNNLALFTGLPPLTAGLASLTRGIHPRTRYNRGGAGIIRRIGPARPGHHRRKGPVCERRFSFTWRTQQRSGSFARARDDVNTGGARPSAWSWCGRHNYLPFL